MTGPEATAPAHRGTLTPLRIAVCAKQVADPDTPPSRFKVDQSTNRVVFPPSASPVVNGFDLHAVEAALKIREAAGVDEIVVISVGHKFANDVMKKALSMGADRLVLVNDPAATDLDAAVTVKALAGALGKLGPFDLILCGRQASDLDQAQVPIGLAEVLGLPLVTLARAVDLNGTRAIIERVISDGHQVIETPLPAVVTVSNELGEPRYPTLRGIMAAGRKMPEVLSLADVGITAPSPVMELVSLRVPERSASVEWIEGEDGADKGRRLAVALRGAGLI